MVLQAQQDRRDKWVHKAPVALELRGRKVLMDHVGIKVRRAQGFVDLRVRVARKVLEALQALRERVAAKVHEVFKVVKALRYVDRKERVVHKVLLDYRAKGALRDFPQLVLRDHKGLLAVKDL